MQRVYRSGLPHPRRIQPCLQRINHLLQTALQTRKDPSRSLSGFLSRSALARLRVHSRLRLARRHLRPHLLVRCQHAPRQRTVLRLHLHQLRKHRPRAELCRVAAIDPESSGSASRSTASLPKCLSPAPLLIRRSRLAAADAAVRAPANLRCRLNNPESAVGTSLVGMRNMSPSGRGTSRFFTTMYVFAIGVIRWRQLIAQPEFAAQLGSCRLLAEKRIRPAFEHDSVYGLRCNRTPTRSRDLKQRVFDICALGARVFQPQRRLQVLQFRLR